MNKIGKLEEITEALAIGFSAVAIRIFFCSWKGHKRFMPFGADAGFYERCYKPI
jgi:hypothetical protein